MKRLTSRPSNRPRDRKTTRLRMQRHASLADTLLDEHTLPTPLRGFTATRSWLLAQADDVVDVGHRLLAHAAVVCPGVLSLRTHRREVGACVLARAAFHHGYFMRSIGSFTPRATGARGQLRELLRYLFESYEVASWLPSTLVHGTATIAPRGALGRVPFVYPHVAQGGTYFDAGLPITMTRAIARELSRSTSSGPRIAIRSAQLRAAGVDDVIANRTAAYLADDTFGDDGEEALVARFIAFLARVKIEDATVLADLCRFVSHRRRVDVAFSFAGRTLASTLEIARRETPRFATPSKYLGPFAPSGIAGGVVDDWTIREIETGLDLQDEGVRMRHCVAIYAERIAQHTCAIFSASNAADTGLTIEVALPKRVVVQVKGFANRAPTKPELAMLSSWAAKSGLSMALTISA
jgi:hypothetical protein